MARGTIATSICTVSTAITTIATITRAASSNMPTAPTMPCTSSTRSITSTTWAKYLTLPAYHREPAPSGSRLVRHGASSLAAGQVVDGVFIGGKTHVAGVGQLLGGCPLIEAHILGAASGKQVGRVGGAL